MEKSKKPKSNLASRRRFEQLDMNKSTSSLNMSTSSLRSVGEETGKDGAAVQASRRAATVRFAPPPSSLSSAATRTTTRSSRSVSQQALARPGTAAGRPASASGPRARPSPGSKARESPEPGPKAMRRSWGWTGDTDGKELASSQTVAAKIGAKTQHARSSSVPRRLPPEEKEKPLPKRSSKINTTSKMKASSDSDLKLGMVGCRSPPNNAKNSAETAPNSLSLSSMVKVPPSSRTSVTTIGASWESLPSDLQNLGLDVMRYRDDAEAAAVEALQEASAAENLLRCLSAFSELASAAPEQSPQQTVDEFLALHAALTTSAAAAVPGDDDKQDVHHAGEWLRAAVSTDLAPLALYSSCPPPPTRRPSRTAAAAAPAVSGDSPPLPGSPAAAGEEAGGGGGDAAEEAWLEAARRGLGEEMRAWFLGHVERLLDGDVAGTLGQLRRVNDWLDAAAVGSPSESGAAERVRKKIYGYLLDHVESAVVALNGGVAPGRRK